MALLRKADVKNFLSGGDAFSDPVLLKRFPTLHSYLAQSVWEDGKPREVATLLLSAEAGQLKGRLSDRATSRVLWVSAGTLEGLLAVLEGQLAGDKAEWRQDRFQGRQGPRK